jgi:hypothetical protein
MIRTALAASILAAFALGGPQNDVEQEPNAVVAGPDDKALQSIVLGQPFELKFGETAKLSDAPFKVTFDSVLEDSRCPIKVQCVWAGRVVVSLTAAVTDGSPKSFELQLGTSTRVLDYNVALNKVDPPKTGEMTPSDDSYVLTLTVTSVAQ